MMLLFWIAGILLLVWIFRSSGMGHCGMHEHRHGNKALDLLKERYAKGEINKEEYDTKKKDLEA